MSDHCQMESNCPEEAMFECPCTKPPQYICKFHLSNHLIKNSVVPHNVKPLVLTNIAKHKQVILNEISKIESELNIAQKNYTTEIKSLIAKAYTEFNNALKLISETREKLKNLTELILSVNSIKLNRKIPNILAIFENSLDEIPQKFKDLRLINISFLFQGNTIKLEIQENISINFFKEEEQDLKEGMCINQHKLLISLDTSKFYGFIHGSMSCPICDLCKVVIFDFSLHCRRCMFDICDNCAFKNKFIKYKYLTCLNDHALGWIPSLADFGIIQVNCDVCFKEYRNSGWRCIPCEFDMCGSCAEKNGFQTPFAYPLMCRLSHRMVCVDTNAILKCNACSRDFKEVHFRCDNSSCNYGICQTCSSGLGHKVPICNSGHYMQTYSKVKNKWNVFKTPECSRCQEKIKGEDLTCNTCKEYLCDVCLKLNAYEFLR